MRITSYLKLGIVSAVIAALLPYYGVIALAVPPAPPLNAPVVDQSGTLTPDQVATLNQQINDSRKQKDYQIGVLIVSSLEGDSLDTYALNVARTWGIGDKTQDNGVLLLVAMQEHGIRIEVGRKLEIDLTDAEAGRIIRNTISPQFKKGDYFSGISLGIQNIAMQVTGHPEADTSANTVASTVAGGIGEIFFMILFFGASFLSWIGSMLARSRSWWLGGVMGGGIGVILALLAGWAVWAIITAFGLMIFGFLFDWAVSRNYAQRASHDLSPSWWAGGSIFPGGGGGGGSFGGGGFGGGGASGDW